MSSAMHRPSLSRHWPHCLPVRSTATAWSNGQSSGSAPVGRPGTRPMPEASAIRVIDGAAGAGKTARGLAATRERALGAGHRMVVVSRPSRPPKLRKARSVRRCTPPRGCCISTACAGMPTEGGAVSTARPKWALGRAGVLDVAIRQAPDRVTQLDGVRRFVATARLCRAVATDALRCSARTSPRMTASRSSDVRESGMPRRNSSEAPPSPATPAHHAHGMRGS